MILLYSDGEGGGGLPFRGSPLRLGLSAELVLRGRGAPRVQTKRTAPAELLIQGVEALTGVWSRVQTAAEEAVPL